MPEHLTKTVQYATPATGETVTIADATDILVANPAGSLLALTLAMPTASDAKRVKICSTQAVTTLTLTSAKTIVGTLTAFIVGGFAEYVFNSTADKWIRCG